MKKSLLFFLIIFIAVSCSVTSKQSDTASDKTGAKYESSGLSYEKAVVINEKAYYKGINAEYKWLKENYPGFRILKQDISYYDNRPYDLFTIKLKGGEEKLIYFNISSFFGDL